MKKLVTYFSATGVTARVAENLAEAIGADVFEIRPEKLYLPGDLDWMDEISRSSLEMDDPTARPAIGRRLDRMSQYDAIYVGFPIWWYTAPRIINTFLESYDFRGKTIVPFATSGGSGVEKVNAGIRASCPGARLLEAKLLPADAGFRELADWEETVGL